jgi:hypothetical protein
MTRLNLSQSGGNFLRFVSQNRGNSPCFVSQSGGNWELLRWNSGQEFRVELSISVDLSQFKRPLFAGIRENAYCHSGLRTDATGW